MAGGGGGVRLFHKQVPSWLKVLLARIGGSALENLFPLQCAGCGKYGSFLCGHCESSLPRLEQPYCALCAQPILFGSLCQYCVNSPPTIEGIRAPFLMEGAIREAIHSLKYRNLRAGASTLAQLLAQWMEATSVPGKTLIPVPLHNRRLRSRGYNQSSLLATGVGKRIGLPVVNDALVRTRDTPPQVSLSRLERVSNVEGSFECIGNVAGQEIILIDDVVSSGPHHQDSGEAKIRESTAGVSRKPSSDGKARGCSSKQLSGLTAWNT